MGRSLRCAGLQRAVRGVAACGARGCSLGLRACIVLHPCRSAPGLCGLWMPMTPLSSLRSKASASSACGARPKSSALSLSALYCVHDSW